MNKLDYLGLDGNTLRAFITVLEENSVSKAAVRLGVSQSAVSHTLDRLRLAFDDALFVRDGRGIIPTARALSLQEPVDSIICKLKTLGYPQQYDPVLNPPEFTIAANDFQLGLIFPTLLKELYAEGISPKLEFITSGVPSANLRRASRCHMILTPAPPAGKDIFREELFRSKMVCFYDAEIRQSPKTWKQFVDSRYVEVKFSNTESSMIVLPALDRSLLKPPTVTVANFSTLQSFIKGTDLITTQLILMKKTTLQDLDFAPLPLKTEPVRLYLAWHQRDHDDPAHRWLRQRIRKTVASILAE